MLLSTVIGPPKPPGLAHATTATMEDVRQRESVDIKHQDITYFLNARDRSVKRKECDLVKAIFEMKNVDWSYDDNFIGFINHKTTELLQFHREGEDAWYSDAPINSGVEWDKYFWGARSDSRLVFETVRLFFEENQWFGVLPWKMHRSTYDKHNKN